MSMKKFLAVLSTILFIVSTGIGYAGQSGGVASGTGPSLPGGIQSSINPQGLGDSLLFGYYNVRGYLNLINVINTNQTDGAKARIVFRNAKTGVDCLEFTVCLSEGDVWTGYLIDNGTTAALCPFDTDTLTSPTIPGTVSTRRSRNLPLRQSPCRGQARSNNKGSLLPFSRYCKGPASCRRT